MRWAEHVARTGAGEKFIRFCGNVWMEQTTRKTEAEIGEWDQTGCERDWIVCVCVGGGGVDVPCSG
jgi:hypothetical protein